MIYLDNAATSFEKPNIVKQAVNEALEKYTLIQDVQHTILVLMLL